VAADKGIIVPQSSGLKKKGWRMIIMPIPFPGPFNLLRHIKVIYELMSI